MSSYTHPTHRAAAGVREALVRRDKARQAEADAHAALARLSSIWLDLPEGTPAFERAYGQAAEAAECYHDAKAAARQAEQDYLAARIDVATEGGP